MALTNAAKNAMLDHLGTLVLYLSAHTADPGTSGTAEVSGGSYARKAVSWAAAASSAKAMSGTVTINIPASTTVGWVGLWSAATGGTFYGSDDVASEAFGAAGTMTVDTATLSLT